MITPVEAEVLLIAYRKYVDSVPIVSPQDIAEERGISRPAALNHLRKLSERGMGIYLEKKGFAIGERGVRYSRRLIRNHRVLESYFTEVLGIPLEKACAEARRLQYHVGTDVVERICTLVGHPTRCPHGEEIPEDNLWDGGD